MSVRESTDRQISHLVDAVFATVGEPVRYASLFYALYYLVEIEGETRVAFDFKQIRELAERGFYWYGIATITREMAHVDDRYFIAGRNLATVDNEGDPDAVISEHVEEFLFPEQPEIHDDAKQVFATVPTLWNVAEPGPMIRTFQTLEEIFDAVDDPVAYIELIMTMFEAMPNRDKGADVMARDDETGWSHGYNGPAWVSICEHLLRRGGLSETAFVDQSYSIEHNNSRWIDKVDFTRDDAQAEAIRDVLDDLVVSDPDDPLVESVTSGDMVRAVTDILDAAQRGDVDRIFEWAVHFNDDVDVNLRRFQRLVSGND